MIDFIIIEINLETFKDYFITISKSMFKSISIVTENIYSLNQSLFDKFLIVKSYNSYKRDETHEKCFLTSINRKDTRMN